MRKLTPILLVLILLLTLVTPVFAADSINVYYAGPTDGGVYRALGLIPGITFVDDPAAANVFFLNGERGPADIPAITTAIQSGAGLVLIPGADFSAADLSQLLEADVQPVAHDDALSLDYLELDEAMSDELVTEILWSSAPQVRERIELSGLDAVSFVFGYETQEGVLMEVATPEGAGRIFVFTPELNGANTQIQDWAYFNYLIYSLTLRSTGQEPLSYADYPGSPVPHQAEQLVILCMVAGLLITSAAAFWIVKRYSDRHPDALNNLVSDRKAFTSHEAATAWEKIGYHRPLGGFFLSLFLGLLFFVPLIIYQNLILPVYILPSAQALGLWGRVTQFFNLIWLFFDMGTSAAFVKFMAEYRVHDPKEGIKFGQVYIWWQALSGSLQLSIMLILCSTMLPKTAFAIYSWSVIAHAFIQIPGFYQVFKHALTGLQRFDFAQIIELGVSLLFPMITQPIFVSLLVAWGRTNPVFGTSMGGILGLGIAAYAGEFLSLLVGLALFRRLGFNPGVFFLAHFDWKTLKQAFRFGSFEMLGSAAWGVGQSIEILVSQTYLLNYAEVWGNWVLAQNFVYAFNVIATLYNNAMPSISEAISHGRKKLSQYYVAVSYKWGGVISCLVAAMLLSVGDRFILGASGPEFVRAAAYAIPLLIWGAIQYPSWVSDAIERGSNKPWLLMLMIGMEQIMRIGLALLLIDRFQINGLIAAYFIGLLTKDIVTYFINSKVCFKLRFYFWQSLAAPILAGGVHYLLLRWVTGLIWAGDQITSVIIFFIATVPTYPVYAFLLGLFGGWDDGTLSEAKEAVPLSSFMKPFAWLWWKSSELGARISPLHNRFPITIRDEAMEEARTLMAERVEL